MARVRYNFHVGTITNNPLASGGTSVTSAEFAALPAVAGPDTLILILDPAGVDGAPEIVTVTAHTGSSTTATVTRASESSTARAHNLGTIWIHGVTAADIVNLATATPAASAVGDSAVAGSAATSSPSDHKHAREGFSATTPVSIDPDDSGAVGVSTSPARSDHEHPVTTGAPTSIGLAGANTEGSGTGFARDTHVHAYSPPTCRVYHNADQSVSHASFTVVAFNTERFDTSTMHDTVTNNSRITIPVAGVYAVSFTGEFESATTYQMATVDFLVNGATAIAVGPNSAGVGGIALQPRLSLTTIYKFAANDYVTVRVRQENSGSAAKNLVAIGNYTPEFSAVWLGVG